MCEWVERKGEKEMEHSRVDECEQEEKQLYQELMGTDVDLSTLSWGNVICFQGSVVIKLTLYHYILKSFILKKTFVKEHV